MKNKILIIVIICVFTQMSIFAQQNLFESQNIESGIVNADNSVTFRFLAPNAQKVMIAGDFIDNVTDQHVAGLVGAGLVNMIKNNEGVWEYTTQPLESELYSYVFMVDDISTIDPNNPNVIRDFSTLTNVFIVGNGKADIYKVNQVPHGTLSHRWYESKGLNMTRRINIYTPPGYETSDNQYPTLYLLHGMGGDEDEWIKFGRATQILDNLIAQGKAKPMVLVIPNGHAAMEGAPGESSRNFYKPKHEKTGTMDGLYEKNFKEIIDFVEKNYRVVPNKANRAIAGLSMGGFHSMHISRHHENMFDYIGLFSAAVMKRPSSNDFYSNYEESLKKQIADGVKLYWLGCGTEDFLFEANGQFRAELDDLGLDYTYLETGDGHVWKNWRIYLNEFAPLLFK